MSQPATSGPVDEADVARFAALARDWWDPEGAAKPLHRINPLRLQFIRDRLAAHFGRDPRALKPFGGLTLLDVGCGAGLVAEPMARLGFTVTGIDAGTEMLAAARAHAAGASLAIDYRAETAAALAASGQSFDTVLMLEVVEHVPDAGAFLSAAAPAVGPGGALILSTLNRTVRGFLLGIVAAEQVLGWVPRGTHDWRRFQSPSTLARALRGAGLRLDAISGMRYDPVRDRWSLSPDLGVNYLMVANRLRR